MRALFALLLRRGDRAREDEAHGALASLTRGLAAGLALALSGCAAQLDTPATGVPWYSNLLARCDDGELRACLDLERDHAVFGARERNMPSLHAAEKACSLDHADSCRWLAAIVEDRPHRSPALLWKACHLGNQEACSDLAYGYSFGREDVGLRRDPVRSVEATEERCRLGDRSSCWHVVRALWEGTCALGVGPDCSKVQKDPERVDANLRRLYCDGKDVATCATLVGLLHTGKPCPRGASPAAQLECYSTDPDSKFLADPARALGLVAQGCEGGVALACFAEADLLYKGDRAAADRERAVALLERTCAGGAVESCFRLGRIHLASRDVSAAVERFTRASERAEIKREAGLRLIHKQRLAEAEPFLSSACGAGDRTACEAEGRLLVIMGRRIDAAVPLLQRACEDDGALKACRALAHVYAQKRQGLLVKKYFALGQAGDTGARYRAALKRAVSRRGDVADDVAFWATVACPPLLILALPKPAEHGYGFDDLYYPEP